MTQSNQQTHIKWDFEDPNPGFDGYVTKEEMEYYTRPMNHYKHPIDPDASRKLDEALSADDD